MQYRYWYSPPVQSKAVNFGPRESKIMQPMIDKLESINQICRVFDSEWLSPALLAPKPHQENVFDINDYIWQLCVNYIWTEPCNENHCLPYSSLRLCIHHIVWALHVSLVA